MLATPLATSLVRQSVPDQIFESTCRAILGGQYAPGEKLPTQRRLAQDYGVNMATVREAVKKLEQLRLVEVRQGDAMRVRDWRRYGSLDVVAHMLFGVGAFDREVFTNVLEARRLLLTECARLAAARRTEAQAAKLSSIAAGIAAEPDDAVAQTMDWEFYEELADASGNLVFSLILNTTRDLYLSNAALFRSVVGNRDKLIPMYAALATAIERHDTDTAADSARKLAATQERQMLDLIATLSQTGAQ
ncbi:MAG: FadR family transcriptional regulator [Actinobacteria bacterium]|nr:FadR family transcriptional regulator [Actinomycetota bacterium]